MYFAFVYEICEKKAESDFVCFGDELEVYMIDLDLYNTCRVVK